MANFNGFPATYTYPYQTTTAVPQYYPQQRSWQMPYQDTQTMVQQSFLNQQNNSMIWVQGEAGAKAYIVPNGTTVPLWDSENQVIYIKSVDSSGKPTMTILDYTDRNAVPVQEEKKPEYVTKEQLDSLNEQVVTKDQLKNLNAQIFDLQQKLNDYIQKNTRKETRNNGKSSV